jgi:DNA repair protein RadD
MADALWYFQEEAVNSLFHYFDSIDPSKPANPLVLMPTGTGKSHVIAEFSKRALNMYRGTRILMLTHVKELIEQNAEKLLNCWPEAPLGIYSAGLKKKQFNDQIIYAGVQSVAKNPERLGRFDLIKIDEAHAVPPEEESNYRKVLTHFQRENPWVRGIGLTATGYRQGQGRLTEGDNAYFTDVVYDITGMSAINRLIAEGYMSPLLGTPTTSVQLDISGVGLDKDGDYNKGQLQRAVNKTEITAAALQELVWYGQNRRSWVIFCSGTEHADDVAKMLWDMGIPAASIHSKLEAGQRERRINAFKNYQLRCLTTNNILTTGFDHKALDLIGILRPTTSVSLWVQMLGRGTRISIETGKQNCLVLDFTKNTINLGPINDPVIPKPRGEGGGVAPIKICDIETDVHGITTGCGFFNHISARYCCNCGKEFSFEVKIQKQHSGLELIRTESTLPIVKEYNIRYVTYSAHISHRSGGISLKAVYVCDQNFAITEWIALEHPKMRGLAGSWWRKRSPTELPATVADALQIHNEYLPLTTPRRLTAWVNTDPVQLMNVHF